MSKFANIALPLPIFQNYTYSIPEHFQREICPGYRVLVPVGKRKLTGYVISVMDKCDRSELKEIHDLIDREAVVSLELIKLAQWISEYYICPVGLVIKAMLPGGINLESKNFLILSGSKKDVEEYLKTNRVQRQEKILSLLIEKGKISIRQLRKIFHGANLSSAIDALIEAKLIISEMVLDKAQTKIKFETWIRLSPEVMDKATYETVHKNLQKSAPTQAKCLEIIFNQIEISLKNILQQSGAASSALVSLEKKGYIDKFNKEITRSYFQSTSHKIAEKLILNEYQKRAIFHIEQAINAGKYKTFLLHGVTGSGKTQVYIEAIRQILTKGKTAIVLVPEISLTPQTVSRFTRNFPNQVAVLHSRMSNGERYDSWRKIKEGKFKIAIGPRSAIFAPLNNLGLIVVDEEHESSYKQYDAQPLYHARDVAVYRGALNNGVIILGSATPSLESYYNCKIQKYHLLDLPSRIDEIPMPTVSIIDMLIQRKRYPGQNVAVFSKQLQEKIKEKLNLGQQIILLQNRRGFSTHIKCKDCGHIEKCEHCEITLTYHAKGQLLKCHYCNFTKKAPISCPGCGGSDILFRGIGTQKVEKEINSLFPQAKIVRMDLDTTSHKWAHDKILGDFAEGKFNILLGTQMVAKGLDFQNVTLVGVISADTSLLLPDFRSTERTFQLLTQVAGRAGRKELLGEVYIQTYSPDNPGLKFARLHDFKSFFINEMPMRKELNYPPYGRLAYILFQGEAEEKVELVANRFSSHLNFPETIGVVFGPIASPLSKLKDKYRWQIIIKSNKQQDPAGKLLRKYLIDTLARYKKDEQIKGVKITIDIDPVSLL